MKMNRVYALGNVAGVAVSLYYGEPLYALANVVFALVFFKWDLWADLFDNAVVVEVEGCNPKEAEAMAKAVVARSWGRAGANLM